MALGNNQNIKVQYFSNQLNSVRWEHPRKFTLPETVKSLCIYRLERETP
jgi:hypothetical protein